MEQKINQKQADLRDRLMTLMEKKNLKPAEIARITGRSEGTMSELLRDKKQFSDKLLNVIYDSLRDYLGDNDLVHTRQFDKIWNILRSGKQASDMRLVVGNTHLGKSATAQRFAQENECCWYVKIDRKELTWNQFLQKVANGMEIKLKKDKKRFSTSYLLDQIIALVEEKADANPQLIIDESEVAKNSFFKEFKNLRTATEGILSIAIIGISGVIERLAKLSGLESRKYETSTGSYNFRWYPTKENSNAYTTFVSRISVFRIENMTAEDASNFCLSKGITNKDVIKLAAARWWNYAEADRACKRAERSGVVLSEMTPKQFELL